MFVWLLAKRLSIAAQARGERSRSSRILVKLPGPRIRANGYSRNVLKQMKEHTDYMDMSNNMEQISVRCFETRFVWGDGYLGVAWRVEGV